MGYSKYTEDIIDRWVEDTRDREDAFYRQWQLDHIPPPPPVPGEVHLELAGKRFEDEEVFPLGKPLTFRAIVSGAAAPLEILVTRGNGQSFLTPDIAGSYTVATTRPESIEIDAASGAYHRRHVVHFVEVRQIDRIEGLSAEIRRFTANPPGWTREQFDEFRVRLIQLLSANAVPQSFGDGLVEYFLSVQLEAVEDSAFSQRLETAFTMLKRFAPFSDIAALITEYFRYRTNTFGTTNSEPARETRPLAWVRAFFLSTKSKCDRSSTGLRRGIELVVPEVEYCCMESVRAMIRHDESSAVGMVSLSRKLSGHLIDLHREDRLKFIEARAYAATSELDKASAAYRHLITSPCTLFQAEAKAFLHL